MSRQTVTDTQASAFIAACLAPVPLGKKTDVCRMIERQGRRQARDRWYVAWMEVEHLHHLKEAVSFGRLVRLARGEETDLSERALEPTLRAAVDRMMLVPVPVPSKGELKCKRKWLRFASDEKAAARAIAADEARLGVVA